LLKRRMPEAEEKRSPFDEEMAATIPGILLLSITVDKIELIWSFLLPISPLVKEPGVEVPS